MRTFQLKVAGLGMVLLVVALLFATSLSVYAESEHVDLIRNQGAGRDTFVYSIVDSDDCISNMMKVAEGLDVLFSQHGIRHNIWLSDPAKVTQKLTAQVEVGCTHLDTGQIDYVHITLDWAWEDPNERIPVFSYAYSFSWYHPAELGITRAILSLFDLALYSYVQAYTSPPPASPGEG